MQTVLDADTARRAAIGERDCYVDWIDAFRALPGNPWNADFRDFGDATVIACTGCPAQIVNRCFGLNADNIDHLPEILSFCADHGVEPRFDLDPYGDYGSGEAFFATISRHGLIHRAFHQELIARLDDIQGDSHDGEESAPGLASDSVTIEAVGTEAEADYAMIHERVWEPGRLITVLLVHPAFPCFVSKVNGRPAALGVLHVRGKVASMANGITLPEFRGRGLQIALLRRRVEAARELGCDLIVSQASSGSASMRNQLRAPRPSGSGSDDHGIGIQLISKGISSYTM